MGVFGDYRIGNASTAAHGTGTISVGSGSTSVSGSGTAFLAELHVGDLLLPTGGQVLCVASIASNVSLTLTVAAGAALSGVAFDYNPLKDVETIAPMLAPKGSYQPYSEPFQLGNGLVRGGGLPIDSWLFTYLPFSARQTLRGYCPNPSGNIYIRTRSIDASNSTTGEDVFETFSAVYIWPLTETDDRPKGIRIPFKLTFRQLVSL